MLTFCYLACLVYVTQLCFFCPWTHGVCYASDGVGWVGMLTFCYLAHLGTLRNCVSFARGHMACATPVMGGVGWGGDVKFLHIERKITSVVHSHPPSHYIRKHASG